MVGQFMVGKVIFLEGVDEQDWKYIKSFYGEQIPSHQQVQFGVVIFITKVEQFVVSPINVNKKDRRGWIILSEK